MKCHCGREIEVKGLDRCELCIEWGRFPND